MNTLQPIPPLLSTFVFFSLAPVSLKHLQRSNFLVNLAKQICYLDNKKVHFSLFYMYIRAPVK